MFIENFSRICRDNGTSPSAVVQDVLKLNKGAASSWKQSGFVPNDRNLQQLARYLNCEVADFFKPVFREPHQAISFHEEKLDRARKLVFDGDDIKEELVAIYDSIEGKRNRRRFIIAVEELAEEYGADPDIWEED